MKNALILSLVLLLVAVMATTVSATGEKPNVEIRGTYTIDNDNGVVYYEIRIVGDPLCYFGFTIQSDLEIVEIVTDDTVFQNAVFQGNKVICYSLGNVVADNSLVVTVVLKIPNPGQSYNFHLTEIQAFDLTEEALDVKVSCLQIQTYPEASQGTPATTEPRPTEPGSSEPLPTKPTPTETKPTPTTQPQQSETEATVSSPSTETHPIDTEEKSEAPWFDKFISMNIYTVFGFCFLMAGLVIAFVLIL